MGDRDNIFLKAAFGGKIQIPKNLSSTSNSIGSSTCTNTLSGSSSSSRKSKEIPRKPNAPHRKYSKLEDQLILKAVELKGRDRRAVLAFLKRNCEVLGQEGKLYRDCDIGDKSIHDRLRKRASTFLRKPRRSEYH